MIAVARRGAGEGVGFAAESMGTVCRVYRRRGTRRSASAYRPDGLSDAGAALTLTV